MNAADPAQLIEALRARGAQHVDALRFGQIEALQRRADLHQGKTRQWLDQRLRQLLTAYAQAADQAQSVPAATPEPRPAPAALAGLLQHLARQGVAHGPAAAGVELKAVHQHRGTWARLSLERQLQQALATVPGQAGPLNTQRLLHQALTLMQQAAPAYAQRFMAHVEALLWLDQSGLAGAARTKAGPAGGPVRRTAALRR